jgi:hypothetical protein
MVFPPDVGASDIASDQGCFGSLSEWAVGEEGTYFAGPGLHTDSKQGTRGQLLVDPCVWWRQGIFALGWEA